MNKHLYRVIFNKARGLLMVVAENVSADGKAGASAAGAPGGLPAGVTVSMHPLRYALMLVLGLILPGGALAAIVADASAPAHQQPSIIPTANGVPQIDIQTPSAAGVSRNTYSAFDVDPRGAILNNSRTDIQTQLGGWISGNQKLNNGTARIILNEVNSSAASHLNGYIEVAGDRAQVVIANPAGISCDGCGFINANRATLTTGSPLLSDGRLDGYSVSQGEIRIEGAGLDGRATEYTDLIARAVRVNAGIWANDLRVTTGSNRVDAEHSQAVSLASLGDKPEFAIDVAHLGGMYAGKIRLVGTEQGVGVRNAGTLGAESGNLVVTLDGRLENAGLLQGKQDIQLSTAGGVRNSGTITAQRELLLDTAAGLDNSAGRINAARLDIGAQSLTNREGDIEQTGAQALAIASTHLSNREAGRIGVAETPSGGAGSEPGAGDTPVAPETGATPPSAGEPVGGGAPASEQVEQLADGQLRIDERLDNDAGRILAGGKVTLATESLDNDAGRLGVHQLTVSGGELSNQAGELTVTTAADISATRMNNDDGKLSVGGALALNAGELSNRGGKLIHSDTSSTTLQVSDRFDNTEGLLATNADSLALSAGVLVNEDGRLEHAGEQGLSLRVGDLLGSGGQISTGGALDLDAGDIDHCGATLSATRVDLRANSLDNRAGSLVSSGTESNRLEVAGRLDNSQGGSIASNGDLSLSAAQLSNAQGSIQHAGEGLLEVQADTLDGVGGTLVGNGTLTLGGGQLDLSEGTTSAQRIQVDADGLRTAHGSLVASGTDALELRIDGLLDNAGGTIAANGALDVNAGALDNRAGTLQSASDQASHIQVAGGLDNGAGTLATSGELDLAAGELRNVGGRVQTAHDSALRLTVEGLLDNSGDGRIITAGELAIQAQTLDNRAGRIEHAGEAGLSIAVETLEGAGGTLASNSDLTLSGERLDLRDGDTRAERIEVRAGDLVTAGGQLIATGSDALELRIDGELDNAGGTIAANGALDVNAGALDNRAGTLQSSSDQASHIQVAGSLENGAGTLATSGELDLAAGELRNVGGRVQTAHDSALRLTVEGVLDNSGDGHIVTAGELAIQAQTLDNRAGRIEHAGDAGLSITVETLEGAGGTLASNSGLTLSGERLDLRDGDTRAQRIEVTAGDLITAGGRLVASGLDALQLRIRNLLDNTAGLLAGNGDMTLVADRLVNEGGAIEHAGAGLLSIDVNRLESAGGSLVGNGALDIVGEHIDLRNGNTSAQRIQVDAGELITAGGRLIATGIETLQLQVRERLDNAGGTIAGQGALELNAGELLNHAGVLQSEGALAVAVGGLLDNRAGVLAGGGAVRIDSAALDNREGGVLASLNADLELTSAGRVENAGGALQAAGALTVEASGLNNAKGTLLGSSLSLDTRQQALDNQGGTLAATEGAMTILSGALDNTGGLLQAAGDLAVDTHGAVLLNRDTGEAGGILAGGNLSIASGDLDNRGGLIHAQDDLAVHAGRFDNRNAGVAGSGGHSLLRVDALDNSGGTLHAGLGFDALVKGILTNTGGLISAGELLKLSAAAVLNRDTGAANPATPLGLQGASVAIRTGQLDNRAGLIAADEHIALTGTAANSTLNNSQGTVSSAGSLIINTGAITNTGGTLLAATDNRITANSLTGDGRVLSQGDLGLTLKSDFNNSGEVTANGQARIETSGQLTNSGSLRAGDLDVHASAITNTATGEISGGRTRLTTPGTLTNRGLIDGQQTWINAGTLNNIGTGRIYGDHIAIAAGNLTNREETVGGVISTATIAARERLDLGVSGTLLNREDSLIFSAGGGSRALNIGGALDANGWAIGRAGNVENRSATIESLGGLSLSATTLLNVNDHLRTAEVQTLGPTAVTYIQPEGDNNKYDISNFRWKSWSRAGYYRWKDDPDVGESGVLGKSPIVGVREVECLGESEDSCTFLPGAEYPADDPAWAYFKVAAPDPEPQPPRREDYQVPEPQPEVQPGSEGGEPVAEGEVEPQPEPAPWPDPVLVAELEAAYQSALEEWQLAHAAWELETEARYDALDAKVQAYNDQFDSRKIKAWTQYEVTRTEYATQVTHTAPALIRSGGNMYLEGANLTNRNSQVIAGGALTVVGGELKNEDEKGTHRVHEQGTAQGTYSRWRGGFKRYHQRRWGDVVAYNPADVKTTINLNVAQVVTHANGEGSDYRVGARDAVTVQANASGASAGSLQQDARTVAGGGVRLESGQALGAIGGQKAGQVTVSLGKAVAASAAASAAKAQGNGVVGTASGGTAGSVEQTTPDNVGPVGNVWDLPTNSLFKVSPGSGSFLVETDPRFTNQRTWLNSDYLLGQLSLDAAGMQQRIGDGFYEQWLIREQVSQLTGRRFLEGYGDDEAQYRALMEAGVTLAQDWNLRPGVALSAEQLARLTSDIVWLVEETVRLPDGTLTTALVPKVYLVPREGDLDGNGTLISAESIDLRLEGDLVNSGTIAGRSVVQLSGDNLRNLGGRISGEGVLMQARTDLENLGGRIDAQGSLLLSAGRDLTVASTTQSAYEQAGKSDFSRTNLDRVAGLYVSKPGGTLAVAAGRDVTLTGAEVVNAGSGGQTLISAGRDLTLATVQTSEQENIVADANNYLRMGETRELGTRVQTAGDLILTAGNDLNARAAQISSEAGAVLLNAGNDVNLTAGEETHNFSEAYKRKHSGLLGSTTTTSRYSEEQNLALGTSVSGQTVQVQAGNDLTLVGSSVVSDMGTVLVAGNDVSILAAQNSYSQSHYEKEEKSGVMQSGAAVTVGKQMQSADSQQSGTYATASTVGSLGGDVTIQAGGDYRQVGSHVVAPGGDIAIRAKRVEIVEARETSHSANESKFRQSGVTAAVSSPVISALQTADQMKQASSRTDDRRLQALAAVTTGLSVSNAASAVGADPAALGGLNISVTAGSSKSDSRTETRSDTAAGSTVSAGGNVRIVASGAGQDSDLTIRGGAVTAGGDVLLKAEGDVALLAARNSSEMERESSSSSVGAGVAVNVGSNGASYGLTANASASKGDGESQDITWTHTQISAGNRLTLESGGDATLRGAVASGEQVVADIGGNLAIESLQDIHTFRSKDQSIGGSVTVGGGASASLNVGQQKIDSDYASVTEQSGIKAGDGGFDIRVEGNTDLKGAVIASNQSAIDAGLNSLDTGTLTHADIVNHAEYDASSLSLGAGYSSATGIGASTPVALKAGDDDSSTTHSGVSGGALTVRDAEGQAALADLKRDVNSAQDGSNALKPIFDLQEIETAFEITQAFVQESGAFLQRKSAEAANARNALKQEQEKPESERNHARIAELKQTLDDNATWEMGGAGRLLLTALSAGASGNVTGGTGEMLQASAVNFAQGLAAQGVKQVAGDDDATRALLHGMVGCLGAAGQGGDCGSGALGSSGAVALNLLLDQLQGVNGSELTATEKEARSNLVASLLAGAAAASGGDAGAAGTAGKLETENNGVAVLPYALNGLARLGPMMQRALPHLFGGAALGVAVANREELGEFVNVTFSPNSDVPIVLPQESVVAPDLPPSTTGMPIVDPEILITTYPANDLQKTDTIGGGYGDGGEVDVPSHTGGKQIVENGPWNTVLPVEDQLDGVMYIGTHAGSNRNHVNGSIGEIRGHADALEQGHLSIEPPDVVTAPGVDYVTYNPITEEIVLWDAKYRSEGGNYPSAVSDAQLKRWTSQLENTIRDLPDGDLKRDALDAYEQGRIKSEIFRWPK